MRYGLPVLGTASVPPPLAPRAANAARKAGASSDTPSHLPPNCWMVRVKVRALQAMPEAAKASNNSIVGLKLRLIADGAESNKRSHVFPRSSLVREGYLTMVRRSY